MARGYFQNLCEINSERLEGLDKAGNDITKEVTLESKLLKFYELLFKFENNGDRIYLGACGFDYTTKNKFEEMLSGLSNYADYSL